MSDPLEKFILGNREKFDSDTPGTNVWEKINERMNSAQQDKAKPVISFPFKRLLAAAAVLLLMAVTGVLYYSMHKTKTSDPVAHIKRELPPETNHLPVKVPADTQRIAVQNPTEPKIIRNIQPQGSRKGNQTSTDPESGEAREMFYYTKLIEIKHEELKTLEKDEPLLYRQFAGDVQKLDSVYRTLKIQLPDHSNREQVIEAMISNLQLQIGLLNRQLKIIKQIKHSKKTAYEKAYKSV